MSEGFAIIPNWLVRDPATHLHDKIVYAVLASHTGRDGSWFISHGDIAAESGISVSSVQRALLRLRDRGLVAWEERRVDGGKAANLYSVSVTERSVSVTEGSGQGGPGGSVSVTDQKKNPKKNPKKNLSDGAAAPTKRGSRLPEDFTVTPEMVTWARETTPLVGAQATEEFMDYWRAQPGQRGVKMDWVATWRNWMRKAQQIAEDQRDRRRPAGNYGDARVTPLSPAQRATLRNEITPEQIAEAERLMAERSAR